MKTIGNTFVVLFVMLFLTVDSVDVHLTLKALTVANMKFLFTLSTLTSSNIQVMRIEKVITKDEMS